MAVTIPVMAKARIGHFAEAQVLKALGGGKARGPGRNGPAGAQLGRDQGRASPHQDGVGRTPFQLTDQARNV